MEEPPKPKRFGELNEEGLDILIDNKDSKNTKSVIRKSVNIFREYLIETGKDPQFEDYESENLAQELSKFWGNARQKNGERYKTKSMQNIRYGIKRYMLDNKSIDIVKDVEFKRSNSGYKAVSVDLKKRGLGDTVHKDIITEDDMKKLYALNPDHVAFCIDTPVGLQYKVWFDILFFLCRRGRENQRDMNKSTYAIQTDSKGRRYVYQTIGEMDKNHRSDDTEGRKSRMYAIEGKICFICRIY